MKTLTSKIDLFALCDLINLTTRLRMRFSYHSDGLPLVRVNYKDDCIYIESVSFKGKPKGIKTPEQLLNDIKALQQQYKIKRAA